MGVAVPLRRLERRHLPPEGSALSTELQGLWTRFYLNQNPITSDPIWIDHNVIPEWNFV